MKREQNRSLERLGLRLKQVKESLPATGPVIWLHALSVGEVSSALPLVKGLRESICPAVLVFTATTRSGRKLAEELIRPHVDLVLFSPLDLPCSVRSYLEVIRPDLFILVETDFWPNWLRLLKQRQVPMMLVNGRISATSFAAYRRFAFFFRPMFRCFDLLAMQTTEEREKMLALGIPAERLVCLGNLKYELPAQHVAPPELLALVDHGQPIWVCGSTHPGEEELILAAFKKISNKKLCLIIAPRKIERSSEVVKLAQSMGLAAHLRSSGTARSGSVLILDTIGELASCYGLARLAFIGGSLVDEGGHNPIEAAVQGVPVLFGPHLEDFAEIACDLIACGGAKTVTAESLAENVAALLADATLHTAMAKAAQHLVEQQRGGVERHLLAVRELLGN